MDPITGIISALYIGAKVMEILEEQKTLTEEQMWEYIRQSEIRTDELLGIANQLLEGVKT